MNFLTSWLNRSFFIRSVLLYSCLMAILTLMQTSKGPTVEIIGLQVVFTISVIIFSRLYTYKSIISTCFIILVFQLLMQFGLRFFYYHYFDNPLGYNPADAYWYDYIAEYHMTSPISEFKRFLDENNVYIDDRGMNYVTYLIYHIAGTHVRGLQFAIIANSIAISFSSYFVYKLGRLYFDKKVSTFITFVWGTELYAVYTAASGLKENYMLALILPAFYFLAKLYKYFELKNIIYFFIFASSALLFRMALFYMLVLSFFVVIFLRFPFIRKYIVFFTITGIIVVCVYYYNVVDTIALERGYSYDALDKISDNKLGHSGMIAQFLNYFAGFIGPFPNIVATGVKANYITMFSFSSFCKVMYSFFFIYGAYAAIRYRKYEYVPLLSFWLMHIVMLLFTFFTQHDRYQWPHIPIMLIIAALGGIEWHRHRHYIVWDKIYFVFAMFLIVFFNFR